MKIKELLEVVPDDYPIGITDSSGEFNFISYDTKDEAVKTYASNTLATVDDIEKMSKAIVTYKDVTDTSRMFFHNAKVTSVDLSGFDSSEVTSMGDMFSDCTGLTSVDLSNLDTHNVTSMRAMFNNCPKLLSLDLSTFDTRKVTDMYSMFFNCYSLTSLDLSGFDVSSVKRMNYMFNRCFNITTLDLSNFDTHNVNNMSFMFWDCRNLTTINGVIDMKSCKYYLYMFKDCPKLKGVKIKNPPPYFEKQSGLHSSQYIVVS